MTALQYFIETMGIDIGSDELTEFMEKEKQQIIDALYHECPGVSLSGTFTVDEYISELKKISEQYYESLK